MSVCGIIVPVSATVPLFPSNSAHTGTIEGPALYRPTNCMRVTGGHDEETWTKKSCEAANAIKHYDT